MFIEAWDSLPVTSGLALQTSFTNHRDETYKHGLARVGVVLVFLQPLPSYPRSLGSSLPAAQPPPQLTLVLHPPSGVDSGSKKPATF